MKPLTCSPRYTRATWADAGLLREALTADYADWHEAGFIASRRAWSLRRRAAILARLVGRTTNDVEAQLIEDGRTLAEIRD